MENDTVEKRVKNNYDFVNNEVKAKIIIKSIKKKYEKDRDRNLSEDEKIDKRNYGNYRYKNMSDANFSIYILLL